MGRRWVAVAACLGAAAVAFGAFGAHGLEGRVRSEDLATWETAARYQMYHAVALLAAAALRPYRLGLIAALFLAGTLLFSGSLYLLVLTNTGWFGAITPLGGLCFIAGWVTLAYAGFRDPLVD
ncbi:MAG: DUF423 domain-containing protein [Armatimonadetes bacterium]|nr:DUF423 domain-containing protein [Armatimonadota bacterium]